MCHTRRGHGAEVADHVVEIHTGKELHDVVKCPLFADPKVVQLYGVRRSQLRRGLGLPLKPLAELLYLWVGGRLPGDRAQESLRLRGGPMPSLVDDRRHMKLDNKFKVAE